MGRNIFIRSWSSTLSGFNALRTHFEKKSKTKFCSDENEM